MNVIRRLPWAGRLLAAIAVASLGLGAGYNSSHAAEVDLFGDAAEGAELNRMGPDDAPARLMKISSSAFDAILAASEPATTRLLMPSGEEATLILSERRGPSSIAPGAVLHEVTANGIVETPLIEPEVIVGKVDGQANSLVVLTRVGPHVFGRIEAGGASYELLPADTATTSTSPSASVLTILAPSNRAPAGAKLCEVEKHPELMRGLPARPEPLYTDNLFTKAHLAATSPIQRMSTPDRRISVGIDTTHEAWQRAGSSTLLQYYIVAVMTQVDVIYRRDLQTAVRINGIRTFTTPSDPYGSYPNDPYIYMAEVGGVMTNPATPAFLRDADATHLIHSTTSYLLGGIAWIDSLCHADRSRRTGFSNFELTHNYPTSSFTWDLFLMAHELGHNVGSPHTHCYNPPIDQCYNDEPTCYSGPMIASPGTIMSYCYIINQGTLELVFSQREVDLMRAKILGAACLVTGTPPPTATATPIVTPTPTPAPNDNFTNAIPITTTADGNNFRATREAGEPLHASLSATSGSLWYNWTATVAGATKMHTCGSSLDTVLGVYTGTAVDTLTPIASNDDSTGTGCNNTRQSEVIFNALAGTVYRVAVSGYFDAQGDFTLTVVPPPGTYANGDADGNGSVNVADLTLIYNRIAGFVASVPGDGDLDNNNVINSNDATILRAMLVP